MKRKTFLALCLSVTAVAWAQTDEYNVRQLPTHAQMPVGNVHGIYRDREGYMWYSTEENLCRDNGYQIDVFCSDSRNPRLLESNFIMDIAEDGENRLWFGTSKGTYVLDKKGYEIHQVDLDEVKGRECEALIGLSDGTVWLSSGDWLVHLDSKENVLHRLSTADRRNGVMKYANSFYEDSRGGLWLMENEGAVCRFDNESGVFVPYEWDGLVKPQRMLEDRANNCYWIGTWGHGVVRFEPDATGIGAKVTMQPVTFSKTGLTSDNKGQVIDLTMDKDGRTIWVTAMDGLYAYRPEGGVLDEVDVKELLPKGKNIVNRMGHDGYGHVWVAGFSPHSFVITSSEKGLRREVLNNVKEREGTCAIVDFCIMDGSCMWFWDPRIGLGLHDMRTGHTAVGADQSEDKLMRGSGVITPNRDGGMWMASDNKILRLNHDDGVIVRSEFAALPDASMFGLYDPGDGYLWAATTKGLKKVAMDGANNVVQISDSSEMVFRIAVDKDGNYYYHGSNDGLVVVEGGEKKRLLDDYENCSCMTLDNGGTLWFGTSIGRVYRYSAGDSVPQMVDGLSEESGARVLDIKRDGRGHVWAVWSHKVKEWNPNNGAYRSYSGNAPNVNMDYFRTMAAMGDSMCVGGADGLCVIASSAELDNMVSEVVPKVSAAIVDGVKIFFDGAQSLELSHDVGMVELNLTTLDHLYAPLIHFAYRLRKESVMGGNDNQKWNILPRGENVIRFSALQKGDYVLEVKATDPYGMWSKAVDACTIVRLPAWWETWWAYMVYALIVIGLAIWGLWAYSANIRRKRTRQMEEQVSQMKLRFFTNMSHELRTPLSLIMLPVENLMKKVPDQTLTSSDCKGIESIYRNSKELLRLINQLLDFRRMELGDKQIHAKTLDVKTVLSAAIDAFRPLAENKGVALSLKCEEKSVYCKFDNQKIHHVVWNLLGNAMKFTGKDGSVDVIVERTDENIRISVADTGIGISEKDLKHVFERYYQADEGGENGGSGIGLHLVDEIVRMHGGQVGVDSELGKGSTFWFTLPLKPNAQEPVANVEVEAEETADDFKEPVGDEGKTLLLVEDNVEFRSLMVDELRNNGYTVVEASDGQEALERLKDTNVRLVISDVMMPLMDGFQLCKSIKTDLALSHIPVILLTAKTDDESRLEGYKMGADCYVTKPFGMELLMNRIEHLSNQQTQRQQEFKQGEDNDAVAVTRSKIDEEFLQKAIEVMERHMGDVAFGVKEFSSEMCTSRMTLYRKIHAITGMTPTDFMVAVRMKKAMHLLRESSLSISSISDMTGFSSPSYFSKVFKSFHGILPKEARG